MIWDKYNVHNDFTLGCVMCNFQQTSTFQSLVYMLSLSVCTVFLSFKLISASLFILEMNFCMFGD